MIPVAPDPQNSGGLPFITTPNIWLVQIFFAWRLHLAPSVKLMILKSQKPQAGERRMTKAIRKPAKVPVRNRKLPQRRGDQESPEQDTTTDSRQRQKGKYAERYKYIRFVERKKVLRKMRQMQQQLMSIEAGPEKEQLELKLTELRRDLMYIDKFPGNEKYISLFPSEGSLSESCIKKQTEIRDMIVNKTAKADFRENHRAKMDVIKNDDFFASPEDTSTVKIKQTPSCTSSVSKTQKPNKKSKGPETAHPSWDAKKNNQKLTGSIADQKFEGSRLVFNDSDNE
jgi:hypothetical protein